VHILSVGGCPCMHLEEDLEKKGILVST